MWWYFVSYNFSWIRKPGGGGRVYPHRSGQLGPANVHFFLQWVGFVQHKRGSGREGALSQKNPLKFQNHIHHLSKQALSSFYQVHNFMLGLNLNTSMPFSPLNEITYSALTPEEEVDAVTGKRGEWLTVYGSTYKIRSTWGKRSLNILHSVAMIHAVTVYR